jgi:hypothetical protein
MLQYPAIHIAISNSVNIFPVNSLKTRDTISGVSMINMATQVLPSSCWEFPKNTILNI